MSNPSSGISGHPVTAAALLYSRLWQRILYAHGLPRPIGLWETGALVGGGSRWRGAVWAGPEIRHRDVYVRRAGISEAPPVARGSVAHAEETPGRANRRPRSKRPTNSTAGQPAARPYCAARTAGRGVKGVRIRQRVG